MWYGFNNDVRMKVSQTVPNRMLHRTSQVASPFPWCRLPPIHYDLVHIGEDR
ncbi:MAG: hypothetical protein LC796_13800 [Acidobacteria bacterium]|nr:hypothetical protein [Acidobacteriota bacterium]